MPIKKWLKDRRVTEVECMVPDLTGIPRGKILPTVKFLNGMRDGLLRLPESIFLQTVTGDFVDTNVLNPTEPDLILHPDPKTIRIVPWYDEPTAQVICRATYLHGREVDVSPRAVLRRVIDRYA